MQEMRSLPAVFRFVMAVLRFGVGALVVCFTAMLALLRGFAWLCANDRDSRDEQRPEIETSWSMEALDNPIRLTTKEPRSF
jgi:hypothetical protein